MNHHYTCTICVCHDKLLTGECVVHFSFMPAVHRPVWLCQYLRLLVYTNYRNYNATMVSEVFYSFPY